MTRALSKISECTITAVDNILLLALGTFSITASKSACVSLTVVESRRSTLVTDYNGSNCLSYDSMFQFSEQKREKI